MKHALLFTAIFACLSVVVFVVVALGATAASAQSGTTGIPVVCKTSMPALPGYFNLQCTRPDGSTFTPVPTGNYLLVTDILILAPQNAYSTTLHVYNGTSISDSFTFRGNASENKSEHFTMPLAVLPANWWLQATNSTGSGGMVSVYITGLLSTNYAYLPLILK